MDDLLITEKKPVVTTTLVRSLGGYFSLEDLSPLNFFIGIEAVLCTTSFFLSQTCYIWEIVDCTKMRLAMSVLITKTSKDP